MKKPADIRPEFADWPNQWMGVEEDLHYGRGILTAMRPFVEHLIAGGLKEKTIHRHLDNLWLLGGEIIRDVDTSGDYATPPLEKLRESVDPDEGPYCRHLDSESEIKSFNATCRKLYRFLEAEP